MTAPTAPGEDADPETGGPPRTADSSEVLTTDSGEQREDLPVDPDNDAG